MSNISSVGLADNEIIDFFSEPIGSLGVSALEGNRAFELIVTSSKGSKISIYSEMANIPVRTNIRCIFLSTHRCRGQRRFTK